MAIDLSGINPAYPVEGVPTTASVRANFDAIKEALEELDDTKASAITAADGRIKFGGPVSAPALAAGDTLTSSEAQVRSQNSFGSIGLIQGGTNSKGIACFGPSGAWDGWLIYRLPGTSVAYLGVSTPSTAAGAEAADAAFVRAVHASDRRIKSELEEVGPTLEKLRDITAYTYKQQGYDVRKLGTIAQDWQKHWPEATPKVIYAGEQRLGIDPLAAVAILLVAVQELASEVESMRATMKAAEA